MIGQDLFVFKSSKHALVDFPREFRGPDHVVVTAADLEQSPEQLYGRYLRNVYLYWGIGPRARAVILARIGRAGPSEWFEFGAPKPPLPSSPPQRRVPHE